MKPREFKDGVFEQLARIGAAFSSPKRIEIVDLLAQGPRSVDSIATATAMTVANTSRHLSILRTSGLVSSRRDGLHVVYRLAEPSVATGYQALRALAESRLAEVRELANAFFGEVDGVEPIGIDELLRRAESGNVTVIDVRPRLEYEAGHLPGAISIPLDELPRRLGELATDRTVVAYCRGPYCVMSAQAVAKIRRAGRDALRLVGGPLEWSASGLPIASSLEPPEPALTISTN
jgi:rhodanese-related sulfurtransferase/DNA-binding transcriptional ArsR family regulator